jgi:hypothetical protein
MLGMPVKELGTPERKTDVLLRVDPRSVSKREFKRKKRDIEELWNRAM